MRYSAIIRTDHCRPILIDAINSLKAQTCPPAEIIFVDSSRDPDVRAALTTHGRVVAYGDEDFNFSRAINIGVDAADCEHILVISSHVAFKTHNLIKQAIDAAAQHQCKVLYLCVPAPNEGNEEKAINLRRFDGRNGVSNVCAIYPTELLRERPFREEIFSAEDQEWASWYFKIRAGQILRYQTTDLIYSNANANSLKIINEEIAIAYFIKRHYLWPHAVVFRLMRSLLALLRGRHERTRMHLGVALGLVHAWFVKPSRKSKYY